MDQWQGFYSIEAMSRITMVPLRTLREWRHREIVVPSVQIEDDDGKVVSEGYTYPDLTIARLVRALREDQFDFKSAADALRHLFQRLGPKETGWADAAVYFSGRYIFAERPDNWPVTEATRAGQTVMTDLFGNLFPELREFEEGVDILVPDAFRAYVTIDPAVMGGEPVVRGTRIPTSLFADLKARGKSLAAIARAYWMVPRRVIEKVIEYEAFLDRTGTFSAAS